MKDDLIVKRASAAWFIRKARREIREYQQMNFDIDSNVFDVQIFHLIGWISATRFFFREVCGKGKLPSWMFKRQVNRKKEAMAHEMPVADSLV